MLLFVLEVLVVCSVLIVLDSCRLMTKVHANGPMSIRSNIHRYLDSRELHLWISKHKERLLPNSAPNERIIPVFLFDFSNAEIMLLDKYHQVSHNNPCIHASMHPSLPIATTAVQLR
jgi:hypothetical protein